MAAKWKKKRFKAGQVDPEPNKKLNQSGQATVEYILILGVAITLALLFAGRIKTAFESQVLVLGGTLEKHLKTGRGGLRVFSN